MKSRTERLGNEPGWQSCGSWVAYLQPMMPKCWRLVHRFEWRTVRC